MIFAKNIEMMIRHFGDKTYVFGDRPETAYDGACNAYVHVPFCMSTCDHCHFYKELYRHVKKCGYHLALLAEIEKNPIGTRIESLKIGGGTPNLLSINELSQIVDGFRKRAEIGQISIQLLASILTEDYLTGLKNMGVTHVEIGYESFSKDASSNIGRRAESVAHFLSMIHFCRANEIQVCVNVLAGMPNQRETSFVEDLYLIAEMGPETVNVKPLIYRGQKPDRRHFELIELAAEVMLEKGYTRTGLWQFEIREAAEQSGTNVTGIEEKCAGFNWPTRGFGPSAYSNIDGYHQVNPAMDLYIYEQLYGQSRVLFAPIDAEDLEWHRLVQKIDSLDVQPNPELSGKVNWYLRWLQISGVVRNGRLSEKGLLYAHEFIATFKTFLPNPIDRADCIDNAVIYEAEKAFASISIQQMEAASSTTQLLSK